MEDQPVLKNPQLLYSILTDMPIWEKIGIEVKDEHPFIEFTRGNITIKIPYFEVVVMGAKTIYNMFQCLDK